MKWTDIHCHLDYFDNPATVVQEAQQNDVRTIYAQSTTLESQQKVLSLQKQFPQMINVCLGYFPQHVTEDSVSQRAQTLSFMEAHLLECTAIGEVGLDFLEDTTPEQKKIQLETFSTIVDLAVKSNKPLIVHTRGCKKEMLELLVQKKATRVLMHSFVGSPTQLTEIKQQGYFVSVGAGVLEYEWVQKWVKSLPLEHLLLESDGPIDWKEKGTVGPSFIPRIAQKIAEIKGCSLSELHAAVLANEEKLMKKE